MRTARHFMRSPRVETRPLCLWILSALLMSAPLCSAAPAYAPKPVDYSVQPKLSGRVDLRPQMNALEEWRQAQYKQLQASGKATAANYKAIDDNFLARARKAEGYRTEALSTLKKHSGVEVKQGAGGTQPQQGRGLSGDIDTESMSAKEFQRLKKTAEEMGYKVTHQGDAITIEELNVTAHRQSASEAGMGSKVGSSAHAAEAARGLNEETALGYKANNPSASVSDNLKKAAHTLETPPGQLTSTDLQKMGKMAGRNLEELGKLDPASAKQYETLQKQSKMLKEGYSPEAAGCVRDNATPEQRAQDLADTQKRVRESSVKTVKATETWADAKTANLSKTAKQAEDILERAKASGDPELVKQARKNVEQAKSELIGFKQTQAAATEAALLNPSNGKGASSVIAEAKGIPTANQPPSAVRERIMAGDRKSISRAVNEPPAAKLGALEGEGTEVAVAGRGARAMKGLMGILGIYGIYTGVKEGAAQAGEEAAKGGDSSTVSITKTAGYSLWHGLGFGSAMHTGTTAGEESAKQWGEDVKAGNVDPNSKLSQAWAHLRGIGWGLAEFTGLQSIKNAVVEGGGAVKDRYNQYQAEKNLAQQQKGIADRMDAKDKTAADKKPGDQATQEKTAAAEKAAAEKAAAEKAPAERAARERAEKEKAAHERAAREKALREREAAAKVAAYEAAAAKAARSRAEADKAVAAWAAAQKAATAKAAKTPALPPGTHEEVSGWAKNKTGSTKLTYIKDAAGNVIGGYYTHYDKNDREIGREDFKGSAPPTSAPSARSVPAKPAEPDFTKILGGVNKQIEKDLEERMRKEQLAPPATTPATTKPRVRGPGLNPNSED